MKNDKKLTNLMQPKQVTNSTTFWVVGLVMFIVACGAILMRIVLRELPITNDWILDTIFTLSVQIGILFLIPFFLYKKVLKKNTKKVLEFSNFNKTKKANLLLSIPLGVAVFFCTIGISSIWQVILVMLGYTHSAAPDILPDKFNLGLFLLSMFLSAILPAICEEFAMRGGFLTILKDSFDKKQVILISAIAFGLFHSYVPQLFYTACFGALMAFLVLTTKSIYPAIIIHFLNNGIGVYLDFAEKYGWVGGNFFNDLSSAMRTDFGIVVILYFCAIGVAAGITYLIYTLNKTKTLEKKLDKLRLSGFDHTNKRVAIVGEFSETELNEIEMQREVFGSNYKRSLYKPTLRERAFYIGAIVVTSAATLFSFIWGLF